MKTRLIKQFQAQPRLITSVMVGVILVLPSCPLAGPIRPVCSRPSIARQDSTWCWHSR